MSGSKLGRHFGLSLKRCVLHSRGYMPTNRLTSPKEITIFAYQGAGLWQSESKGSESVPAGTTQPPTLSAVDITASR